MAAILLYNQHSNSTGIMSQWWGVFPTKNVDDDDKVTIIQMLQKQESLESVTYF